MSLLVALFVAFFLVDPPLSWVVVCAGVALEVGETVFWMRYSKRRRAAVGVETVLGRRGVALTDVGSDGQVKVDGEIWRARSARGVERGEAVVVTGVDELTLEVERP